MAAESRLQLSLYAREAYEGDEGDVMGRLAIDGEDEEKGGALWQLRGRAEHVSLRTEGVI